MRYDESEIGELTDDSWYYGISWLKTHSIIIECDISIKSSKVQRTGRSYTPVKSSSQYCLFLMSLDLGYDWDVVFGVIRTVFKIVKTVYRVNFLSKDSISTRGWTQLERKFFSVISTYIICAVFNINLTSLKEGGTNLLEEINLFPSWYLKAAANGNLVKKLPMLGTSNFNFDCCCNPSFWWATTKESTVNIIEVWLVEEVLTMIINHCFDIPKYFFVTTKCHFGHFLYSACSGFEDAGWLGVEDKGDG